MKCPNDGRKLVEAIYESSIQIDKCNTCQGIYLDKGELEKIQETTENDYSEELKQIPNTVAQAYKMARAKQEGSRGCPKCSNEMHKREYGFSSQIMVDTCSVCTGVWLDHGEMESLEVFFERSKINTLSLKKGFLSGLVSLFQK